jgi:hypothetical protein
VVAVLLAMLATVLPGAARAQEVGDEPGDEPGPPAQLPPAPTRLEPGQSAPADFGGALQTLRAPGSATGPGAAARGPEIFPDAGRVWMSVTEMNPVPLEAARRGGPWLCSNGQCTVSNGDPGRSRIGDGMLRSIKLQTPTLPLPLTLWGRGNARGERLLDFDPVLLGRRSYQHVCAYRPIESPSADGKAPPPRADKVMVCRDGPAEPPSSDSGEISLGLSWPRQSELADFRYLAIVDSCGNARVQPFQRTFTVPVFEVASGGCGPADGKVLRVFPQGGWIRVTAFNLDAPAVGTVVNATYRVTVPPLENLVESSPARLLFPDPVQSDLQVDCGPSLRKAPTDAQGIPSPRPGPAMVEVETNIPAKDDGDKPADKAALPKQGPPPADKPGPRPTPGPTPMPPPKKSFDVPASGPGPQPLAHEAVVIAPEPLRQGNCKIRLMGQTKRRLVAPLALHVSLTRTDRTINGSPIELLKDGAWVVTPSNPEFAIPPLTEGFDGDSRLRLTVSSDPLSNNGKVVLLADAGRVASALRANDKGEPERARRLVGSVTIHSVPLCGQPNFETLEGSGSCLRAYITIPAMLAMLQLTRAPWLEKPLITRNVFSAVGAALAVDSYDPVNRKSFPVAGQIGGMFENLGDGKLGILAYIGVAPTIPILGSGGNTTSIGFLGGVGLAYVINEHGPDEGVKPAAFLSVLVAVGQANPWIKSGGQ